MSGEDKAVEEKKVEVETEKFICKNCGGTVKFDINKQDFECSSCKTKFTIETLSDEVNEYDFEDYFERERQSVAFEGKAVVTCQNCGLEISFDEHQVATVCPMCSSTQIATAKQKAGIPPEGIIPFKIDKKAAQEKFRVWIKKRWFAPNDLKKSYGEGLLAGMYLPFWTYDTNARSYYTGEGGRTRVEKGRDGKQKTVTDWYSVSGIVQKSFDDIQICASEKEKDIEGILPYNTTTNIKPFSQSYLSGYYTEIYKMKADKGFEEAKEIINNDMKNLAERDILRRYDKARSIRLNTQYNDVKYKHVLLPLWSAAFGYKGKTYRYMVNGETGKVSGKRPYSVPKIIAAVLAAIAAIMLIAFFANKSKSTDNSRLMENVPYSVTIHENEYAKRIQTRYSKLENALELYKTANVGKTGNNI